MLNGGTLTSAFLMSGSTMRGTDQVFKGVATWTGGTINGTAAQSTTFDSSAHHQRGERQDAVGRPHA